MPGLGYGFVPVAMAFCASEFTLMGAKAPKGDALELVEQKR